MDLWLAASQGLGLALAAGALAGAPGRRGAVGTVLLVAAAVAGGVLFGISLAQEDHPAYPGWPLGALAAAFAFVVVRDVAESASRRTDGDSLTSILIAVAALALAGLSIVVSPVAIVALIGLVWIWFGRRRRASRKYEGLRTLR
jgi:hypothetical protein